ALSRSRSAAFRHWLLAAALICAALVPVLALTLPGWHMSSLTGFTSINPITSISEVEWRTTPESGPPARPPAEAASYNQRDQPALLILRWIWMTGTSLSFLMLIAG